MAHQNGKGLDHHYGGVEAREFEQLGGPLEVLPTAGNSPKQVQVICAEIVGIDCASAEGITAHGPAPVLKLCRLLIQSGIGAATPLEAYRGPVLCLRIRSIGEGAALSVDEIRTAFCRWKAFPSAAGSPSMRQTGRPAP